MGTAASAVAKAMQSLHQQVSNPEIHARLWKSYLTGLNDTEVLAVMALLRNGVVPPNWDQWLSKWEGILSQISRHGFSGQQVKAVFLSLQQGGLNGAAILRIFDDFNTGGLRAVHADETIRIVQSLQTGGLTAQQITALFQMLFNTLALPAGDAKEGLDCLQSRNLTPMQVRDVVQALCNPGLAASRTAIKVIELLRSIRASTQSAADVHNFFTVPKAPLNVVQVIELSFGLDFQRLCELLAEVGGPGAVHAGLAACANSINNLRIVIATMHDKEVQDAHRISKPAQVTLLNELQNVPTTPVSLPNPVGGQGLQANNRVERAVQFLKLSTTAHASNGVNNRTWVQILALPGTFRNAGRHPLGALVAPAAVVVNVPGSPRTLRCTGERLVYFLRAHTLQFCSFRLADRTKDDITFWAGNAHTTGTMGTQIQNMVNQATGDVNRIMDDATADAREMSIQFAGNWEAGIIGVGNNYTLLHFMPITTYPGAVQINKHLLIALGFLIGGTNDA